MSSRKRQLIFYIVAAPLFALIVGAGVRWDFERQWHDAVSQQLDDETQEESIRPLSEICREAPEGLEDACATLSQVTTLQALAIAALLFGLALFSAIHWAGKAAFQDRNVLLRLFAPALKASMAAVTLLTALQAILAVGAIYYAEATWLGRVHFGILLAVVAGAAMGIYALAKAAFGAIQEAAAEVFGIEAETNAYGNLWKEVRALAERVGAAPPNHIFWASTRPFS